jgi:hypothetical protein
MNIHIIIFNINQDPKPIPLFTLIKVILTFELKNRIKGRKIKKNNPMYHITLKEFRTDGRNVRTLINWITDVIRKEKEKTRPYNKISSRK